MAYDLEEQEQLATLKGWWKDNGTQRAGGRLPRWRSSLAGWQGWRIWQANQAQQAGALYDSLLKAVQAGDAKALRDAGGTLVESFPAHAVRQRWARWLSARFHFERADLKNAKAQLQWVVERSPSDELRDLARLRLAAVLLDEKAYDEALALLEAKHAAPLDGAVRRAQGRHPGGEEQGRRSEGRLPPRAGESRRKQRARSAPACSCGWTRSAADACAALLRVRAARGAACGAAAACSSMPSMNPMDWFSGSRPAPSPSELPVLTNAQGVKRALVREHRRGGGLRVFSPALVGDSVYAASRAGTRGAPRRRDRARRSGASRSASASPAASAATARSWWSPPTTARCSRSMRRTARCGGARACRAKCWRRPSWATGWCWCAAPTAASSPSAPRTASAAGSTSAPRPRSSCARRSA